MKLLKNDPKAFEAFKQETMAAFNALQLEGLPKITELYELSGAFVNLAYPLPSGKHVKLLNDGELYLGAQVESRLEQVHTDRCYGLVAGLDFLLVCEYGANGSDPRLVIFKRR